MRTVGKAVLTLLALVGVVVAAALFYIDRILIESVERGGSYALGVETELDSLRLGLVSGKLGLSGLRVANPEGFESPHFLSLDRADVHVRLRSLIHDPVDVPLLSVSGLEMSLERSGRRTNYGIILDNLAKLESAESQPAAEEDEAAGSESKRFVIRKLVIRDVKAKARLFAAGREVKEVEVDVPEINVENIGSESGTDLAGLAGVITKAVLEAVAQKSGDLKGLSRDLRGRLARLEDVKIEVPGSVTEIRGAFGAEGQRRLGDATKKGAELLEGLGIRGRKEK